ncbi:cell division protein FtsA [Liquorilactobacillus sucicola DSM 21376 = JCM 15457]|uniref:Cell division protein FtsA n=1 Tax=Liquorilactobacillus sucicola DSM 21376 = JCM 15457 TaxID=1423806 RepID=A0A023CU10_9LACO|nr:cell division protein FtsA [Liquorilactobacillus sucicola]KRN05258.1 cell division protein [Liquorilactobacillus sucicola DSM 21376 = JCM 15457]GAJ25318.1 cell division protein FtsA [Liquorilactobacillus sucicola DSM 21376 = JCM 15457]
MENSGIYVGLDIGTTSIKVIVAEHIKDQMNIIGVGSERSDGLSRGVIVDIDRAVSAIKKAIQQAEQKANIQISKVTVGIPANLLEIVPCNGMIAVSDEAGSSKEIDEDDVYRVTEAALVQKLPPERDVIDIIPDEFIVDGFDGIKDPRGMIGVRLEMNGVVYTGPKTVLHNTMKCVEKAGLHVEGTVVSALALSTTALSDGEQDFGAVIIDIGGGQTTAAVVHDHKLKYTYVDQEGGMFVTKDISVVLNTSLENAEKIKRNYGYATSSLASKDDVFPVEVVGKVDPVQVSGEYLSEIIEARMTQIFEKLRDALEGIRALQLPGGVVLTGGLAALPGMKELAEDIFDVNVKVFIPQQMGLRHPSFSQAIGLIKYVMQQGEIEKIVKSTITDGDRRNISKESDNVVTLNPKVEETGTKKKNDTDKKSSAFDGVKNFFSTFFD